MKYSPSLFGSFIHVIIKHTLNKQVKVMKEVGREVEVLKDTSESCVSF